MIKEIDFDLLPNDNDDCCNECEDICPDFVPVLPTEYGESLSYYEALCKLSKKVDEFETGQVESVNGKTGVVVLTAEDVGALPVGTPGGDVNSVNGKTGVVVLTAEDVGALPVGTEVGSVNSVNGQTDDVVLTAEDVGAIPVSEKGANNGVATIDSDGYVVQPVRGGTGGDVNSVNGKTGVVVLTAEDVGALPVGTEVGSVNSVNGQTDDVVLTAEDVGAANDIHASTHAVDGSDPVTPASINAVNKGGDTMTGTLIIEKPDNVACVLANTNLNGETQLVCGSNNTQVVSKNERITADNLRRIVLFNSVGNANIANSLSLHDVINGVSKNYRVFGEHNKPAGSYTGNGSATKRTINIGGVGNVALVRHENYVMLVTPNGAFGRNGSSFVVLGGDEVAYANGVLTIMSNKAVINGNGNTYGYTCL